MSNQAELDYEKQFQDDLAKATALSLEQQALDDYRRTKKYGSTVDYYERSSQSPISQQEASSNYYAHLRSRHYSRAGSTETAAGNFQPIHLAAPPTQSQRRHSEVAHPAAATSISSAGSRERSKTPPPTLLESDLISFASPTAKKPESSTFEKLIEDLQKFQTTNSQTALVPLGPTAATPVHHPGHAGYPGYCTAPATGMYAAVPPQFRAPGPAAAIGGAGVGGMQLVPFMPQQQQQKVPLTNEELQKLYNMPHPQTAAYPHHMGFMAPQHQQQGYYPQYPQSAPVIPGAATTTHMPAANAAYVPSQYPTSYGFQYNMPPPPNANASTYYQPTTAATSAVSSVSTADVSNPNSALVPQSHSSLSIANGSSGSASGLNAAIQRRQTPPARKQRTGADLIDLSQEDDSRVSVLEAFDPLLNEDDGVWKK